MWHNHLNLNGSIVLYKAKILLLVLSFLALSYSPVLAIEYGGLGGKPAYPELDNPRTQSIFIYTLQPGETKTDGILVVNNTTERKQVLVYAADSQKSTDGSFACEQYSDEKNGIGNWITLQKAEVTLEPSTNVIIPFAVKVPEKVSVGEENGCVLIQEKKANSTNAGVNLSFRTGVRVAITIPGEKLRKLEVDTFQLKDVTDDKVTSKFAVKNLGNVSIDSNINLSLQSILGVNVYTSENSYPLLREDTATFNFEIPKPFWGGIFRLVGNVEYDPSADAIIGKDTNNPKTKLDNYTQFFVIMPQPLAAVIIIVVVSGLVAGTVFYMRYRRKLKQTLAEWETYVVESGDDINKIAQKYKVSWQKLAKVNKLLPPYALTVDMRLKVPPIAGAHIK